MWMYYFTLPGAPARHSGHYETSVTSVLHTINRYLSPVSFGPRPRTWSKWHAISSKGRADHTSHPDLHIKYWSETPTGSGPGPRQPSSESLAPSVSVPDEIQTVLAGKVVLPRDRMGGVLDLRRTRTKNR